MSETIKTDQAGGWTLQLSVKVDNVHLLNLRHETAEGFSALVKWAVENADQLQIACSALQGTKSAPPAPAPRPTASGVPAASYRAPQGGGEIGPVLLKSVKKDLYNKDGVKMNSPKYTVEFGDGKKVSTFKEVWGKAAENLAGTMVYYSTEPGSNPKYTNLAEVRSAG